LWGDEFSLDFAHLNPAIELRRMSYTNSPRIIAQHDHIVTINTAYGVVNLLGKSQRERAELLISIAHPDFRADLRRTARRLFWP
jgi:acyl-CoA hydrolase